MNYIAHLHIASVTQTSFAGNLLGDFQWQADPRNTEFYLGWQLHQAVDTFVDAHDATLRFKELPRLGRRRFLGIIQDVVMDYWLIRHWQTFSDEPFERFAQRAVNGLSQVKPDCPERLQGMIGSLENHNWLPDLGKSSGIARAIGSIQRRWPLGHHLEPFVQELDDIILQAEQPFLDLYPDVLEMAQVTAKQLQQKM